MNRAQISTAFPAFEFASDIGGEGWWQSKPHEPVADARQRAQSLLEWTRDQFGRTQERVAYVTHADIKELMLTFVHGQPLPSAFNTAVTEIRISVTEMQLVDFNDVSHLPGELVSV